MKISINVVVIVFVVVAATTTTVRVSGRMVNVGGKDMWKPNYNYTEWASNQTFFVGDWLGFKFDKTQFDVVEVNETGYEKCDNECMITNITHGAGRDIFELKEAKSYYFICTKGYCWGGMKLAINVTLPLTPQPSPQGNESYNYNVSSPMHLVVLIISMLFAFLIMFI